MHIGFDAKRIFFNRTGLGNYSRGVIEILCNYVPEHEIVLFSPRQGNVNGFPVPSDVPVVYPSRMDTWFPAFWRSYRMGHAIRRSGIDIYHGLSNELPSDIRRTQARSVVTIHDLIFERYPELYKPIDRMFYRIKYRQSVRNADRIVAVSHQTKHDLMEFWGVPSEKIDVVYQGCSSIFYRSVSEEERRVIRAKYRLPGRFLLFVGTVEERKNLLLIVEAMVKGNLNIDLVICGRQTPYADIVRQYAHDQGVANRLHFCSGLEFADLPAIYQSADMMIYPSIFEGFGIPILEGLNSGVPVITTQGGVFTETGGDAAMYIDPRSVDGLLDAIHKIQNDRDLRQGMIDRGYVHASRFREEHIARNLSGVYEKLI